MRRLIGILLSLMLAGCGSVDSSFHLDGERLVLRDPGLAGAYTVKSYLPSGTNAGYESVIIYYPSNNSEPLLPATTLVGGYSNTKENMSWLGQHLASHGFVVAVFTPTNRYGSDAKIWATGHKASVQTLLNESKKAGTPIAGRVDANRIGLMGYSYGGAGTILASNELGSKIRSAVTFCAYNPVTPTNPVPTLFITGTSDTVASPSLVLSAFNSLKTSQPKAFAKFNSMSHLDIPNGGRYHDSIGRFTVAWSQVFLAENADYGTWLNGAEAKKQTSNTSVFARVGDYVYSD